MYVFAPVNEIGYATAVVVTEHVSCHCASVHSCAPIDLHAASASSYLTLTHGCTPCLEHTSVLFEPTTRVVESGLDASYFIIWWPPGRVTHSWPTVRLPVLPPSSTWPLQLLSL